MSVTSSASVSQTSGGTSESVSGGPTPSPTRSSSSRTTSWTPSASPAQNTGSPSASATPPAPSVTAGVEATLYNTGFYVTTLGSGTNETGGGTVETVVSYSSLSMTVTIVVPRGGEWSKQKGGAPIGAIVGGMLGAVVVLTLGLALLLWWMRRTRRASHLEDEIRKASVTPFTDPSESSPAAVAEEAAKESGKGSQGGTKLSISSSSPPFHQPDQTSSTKEHSIARSPILATPSLLGSDLLYLPSNRTSTPSYFEEVPPEYRSVIGPLRQDDNPPLNLKEGRTSIVIGDTGRS